MNSLMMLSIASLFYISILSFVFFIKKPVKTKETKLYSILLIILLIEIVCEISMRILGSSINELFLLNNIVAKIFNVLVVIWITIITLYNVIISVDENKYEKYKKILLIFTAIMSILIILLPISFNIVEDGSYYSYTYGLSVQILLVSVSILLLINFILIILNYKKLQKKYIPVIVALVLLLVSGLIQSMYPEVLLNLFAQALVTFIMYNTIENPDVKMINQLQIANEEAEKANNAKTEFLSSMSHEIRTPLNAITGFSEIIIDSNDMKEIKNNAKDIISASNTLIEIVNGILDISKIESGKLELDNSLYNPKEIFDNLSQLIKPRIDEKALEFKCYIADDIPDVLYGDSFNIKKIITNLLSNAVKYTDKGYVKFDVHCVKKDDNCKLIITVEDTGRGIKEENINKLFNKFERFEERKNTTIEGTGLGLAITKKLVELMNGKIIVNSVYKEGSKFTVMIDQKIGNNIDITEKEEIKDTLDLKDIKILLVDDNELNIKVTTKLLEKYNANKITSVDNGFDCIKKVQEEEFDIILLDDMMPKMSGTETLHKLKEISGFNIPVIALTANAIIGMKEKYLNEGFINYLSKPIEKKELIKVLNDTININKKIKDVVEVPIELLKKEDDIKLDKIEEPVIDSIEYLKSKNVNIDKSLELLGDIDMYNSTVEEFLNTIEDKWQKIEMYKLENNMKDYSIEVHSLKSDSKYLGLENLADISYKHEISSKENDIDFINNNFEKLEEEYINSLNILKNYQDLLKK